MDLWQDPVKVSGEQLQLPTGEISQVTTPLMENLGELIQCNKIILVIASER